MSWQPYSVDASLRVWGIGHTGPAIRENALRTLRVDKSTRNIALLHGSDVSSWPEDRPAHCPFEREDISASGIDFVLLGHYHQLRLRPDDGPNYGYPGSPEPLDFAEQGPHHVLVLTADQDGIAVEPVQINEVEYRVHEVDITGMSTSDQIRAAIVNLAADESAARSVTRVALSGSPEPDVDVDVSALKALAAEHFRYVEIVNRTEAAFDIDQIGSESTTRGAFVRMLQEQLSQSGDGERDVLEHALHYGLKAFAGQEIRRR
jgi:DNA repair exonuclease SbcCD nuclease subunit